MTRPALLDYPSRIVGWAAAKTRIDAWKREGLTVGFTNGVFDLIHPGHIASLTAAGAACDRLVVGLNGDGSVRRLKGPQRPVQTQESRALVMAGLAPVDLVVLFHEDTPAALIETLLPDLLFKGADYTIEQVAGAAAVLANGGRVILLDLVPGQSTTSLIKRSA